MPPPGWAPPPPAEVVCDIVHWCNRAMPSPRGGRWHLGAAARRRSPLRRQRPAPSVAAAIKELCSPLVYETGLPFVRASAAARAAAIKLASAANVHCDPPAIIPVSTADHDDTMLRWDAPDCPCASGAACVAAQLPGAPGPLPWYVPPGTPRADYEPPAFCLLCMRSDAAATVRVYEAVVASSRLQLGRAAVTLPPFQNLSDCPGGYHFAAMGVKPSQHVFSPVCVAGPQISLVVRTGDDGVVFVDQSAGKWSPGSPFL